MFVGLALGEFGAVESLGLEQDGGDQVAYPEELAVGLHALDRESLEPGLFLGSRGAEENAVEQPLDGVIHLFFGWRGVSRVNQVEELSGGRVSLGGLAVDEADFGQLLGGGGGVGHQLRKIRPGQNVLVVVIAEAVTTGLEGEGSYVLAVLGEGPDAGFVNGRTNPPDAGRRPGRTEVLVAEKPLVLHVVARPGPKQLVFRLPPTLEEFGPDPLNETVALGGGGLGFFLGRHLAELKLMEDLFPMIEIGAIDQVSLDSLKGEVPL